MNIFLALSILTGLILIPGVRINEYFYITLIPVYLSLPLMTNVGVKEKLYSFEGKVALLFLLAWTYGFLRGFVLQNDPYAVVRNFAGMVIYGYFYVITSNEIGIQKLLKLVFWIGAVNVGLGIWHVLFEADAEFGGISLASVIGGQARFFYDANVIIVFCMIVVSVSNSAFQLGGLDAIIGKSKLLSILLKSELGYYLMVIYYIIFPFGKGFIINFILIMALIPIIAFMKFKKVSRGVLLRLLFALLLVGFLGAKSDDEVRDGYVNNFGLEAEGNNLRFEQSKALSKEFSFLGAGLGASLKSGYQRDELGYGFEQSYENVIHKLGIPLAITIFIAYFLVLLKSLRTFAEQWDVISAFCFAGSFGLLIPSSGNPMLFAPGHVLIHVMSILMLQHNSFQRRSGSQSKLAVYNSR